MTNDSDGVELWDGVRCEAIPLLPEEEKEMQEFINQLEKMLIDENEELVGTEIAKSAKKKIDKENKGEGGKENEEKQKTTRRKKTTRGEQG